ncbi:dTDP-4-dehydrorhamnose 3,5-epimerase [Alphaproteobacteria bacterium]|nr:dTDP-4-dehydrorhamnose 3,5-epimerase [Alphaproteobacteria bacterium]
MNVTATILPGVLIIEPRVFEDTRGFFKETFQLARYRECGIDAPFLQDNFSRSKKGVLRGLHLQKSRPQGKLVSCPRGVIFDAVVDINPISPTFGKYLGIEISEYNHLQVWIPPGYAHGFCVISDEADLQYKCTDIYSPEDESGLIWDDPEVAIDWPLEAPELSPKDLLLPTLAQIRQIGHA